MDFTKSKSRKLFLFLILLFTTGIACAQVDKEFWFAPPEVTSGHGDAPIVLRISTLNVSSTVTISLPADKTFAPIIRQVTANTTITVDLTSHINSLETRPPNSVRKTGIYISATNPVTVYYEVAAVWNTDIFVLKGKNGLGNEFIIPGQDKYFNGAIYNPLPFSSFDIVATENNTVVTITPTNAIVGHAKSEPFIIKLNKGETYSARNLSQNPALNLSGSVVTSNKPIAVTLKEDSMQNLACYDLIGDQLVPIKVAGNEYVLMKGFLQTPEHAFVTAIYNNTQVFLDGSSSAAATLMKGQLFSFPVLESFKYVRTSKPAYLLHITGFGCEIGMAVLPALNCRGSLQIGFTRSTNEFFGLNILVPKAGINNFTLNGRSDLVTGSSFTAVPGTNDQWYAARLSFNTAQVATGSASLISNSSSSFQIGVINGDAFSSCRFGYFSSFSTLFIGDDFAVCPDETKILDAGPDKDFYEWSTGENTQAIHVTEPGTYWVTTKKENCLLQDTVVVSLDQAKLELGPDVVVCPEKKTHIDGGEKNFSYLWSNGSVERFLETSEPGTYSLEVRNYTGCKAEDEITVTRAEAPEIELGVDLLKCPHEVVGLNVSWPGSTYLWSTGETTASIDVVNEGEYKVTATKGTCSTRDSITVLFHDVIHSPDIQGSKSLCPNVTDVRYTTALYENHNYQWTILGGKIVDETDPSDIRVNWEETSNDAYLELKVIDERGCFPEVSRLDVKINPVLEPATPSGPGLICFNDRFTKVYTTVNTTGSIYTWEVFNGTIVSGQGTSAVTVTWNDTGLFGLRVREDAATVSDICAGTSDIWPVLIFKDSAQFEFNNVTAIHEPSDNSFLKTSWITKNRSRFQDGKIWLRWKNFPNEFFTDSIALPPQGNGQNFEDRIFLNQIHQFQLSGTDLCGNYLTTSWHQNMVLAAEVDTVKNLITLSWNEYKGWPQGIKKYNVWARLNNRDTSFVLGEKLANEKLSLSTLSTSALEHHYWVEALGNNNEKSLSNKIYLAFDHPVFIPNIITPNNDGVNDYFTISNIHLFPKNKLLILNRWGQILYEADGYNNTWKGDGLSSGVYFYKLILFGLNTTYTGSLTINR